jgi:colanic acid biosynthesis glycosyl transferase WcaI
VLYKKMRRAKFLYHVQDLQIEAARDLQMIKSQRTIRNLFRLEKYVLRHADTVSSISDGMIERIQEKTSKPVVFFPNWADLALFYPIADKGGLKEAFGFAPTDKIVLYSGSVGEKQGLEAILDAARQEQDRLVKFVICGSGPYKDKLQQEAASRKLCNVVFMPLQPTDKLNHFLNMADLHLIIQKANASDLVMPSKLTNILAIGGVALVTANEGSALYNLIDRHHMGLLVPAEDETALQEGIVQALRQPTGAVQANALAYARQHLAIDEVMKTYFKQSLAIADRPKRTGPQKWKTLLNSVFHF